MQYNAPGGQYEPGMRFRGMEPLLCPYCAMNELKECRECKQPFTPCYDTDRLCDKCFRLEDDPPWDTTNNNKGEQ